MWIGVYRVPCKTGVTCEDRYRNAVDVSWPDRYNYAARESVLAPFAQQAATGHFIDQTVWNWYFEYQSDKLTRGGLEKLNVHSARETPNLLIPRSIIQTARDTRCAPQKTRTRPDPSGMTWMLAELPPSENT